MWRLSFGHQVAMYPSSSRTEGTCSDVDSLPRCSTVFIHTLPHSWKSCFATRHQGKENAPGVQEYLRRWYSGAHQWLNLLLITTLKDVLPSQCRRNEMHRRCRFEPWVRKIPWIRPWQPTPVFLPGESHGQRSLGSIIHGIAKSWIQLKWLRMDGSFLSSSC